LNISKAFVAYLELSVIETASSLSAMIGGTAPPSSGIPSLKESLLRDYIFSFVLKIETSLISMLISA
jgi:hypothetical protein